MRDSHRPGVTRAGRHTRSKTQLKETPTAHRPRTVQRRKGHIVAASSWLRAATLYRHHFFFAAHAAFFLWQRMETSYGHKPAKQGRRYSPDMFRTASSRSASSMDARVLATLSAPAMELPLPLLLLLTVLTARAAAD